MTFLAKQVNYWAIVPAAGIGQRLGAIKPKQYLELQGRPIIEHSVACLVSYPHIAKTIVVVAAQDSYWPLIQVTFPREKIGSALGGAERLTSVYQGLLALQEQAKADDWVLVHDAVRPCLQHGDISHLLQALQHHPVGGLLGVRVSDTLKRTDPQGQVIGTLDRVGVWRAQTPQMFKYGLLCEALKTAIAQGRPSTDEAYAMEMSGHQPLMVQGCEHNIKITYPEDLLRAEHYLRCCH